MQGPAPRFVFIFTYGRSGSTLLSGYLNALPGYCIRGENYMAVAHLCAFYRAIKASKGHTAKKSGLTVHPWYGIDDIDLTGLRHIVLDRWQSTQNTADCRQFRRRQVDVSPGAEAVGEVAGGG